MLTLPLSGHAASCSCVGSSRTSIREILEEEVGEGADEAPGGMGVLQRARRQEDRRHQHEHALESLEQALGELDADVRDVVQPLLRQEVAHR